MIESLPRDTLMRGKSENHVRVTVRFEKRKTSMSDVMNENLLMIHIQMMVAIGQLRLKERHFLNKDTGKCLIGLGFAKTQPTTRRSRNLCLWCVGSSTPIGSSLTQKVLF